MDLNQLLERAIEARKNSYSPYSKFPVGAAVLTNDGKLYTGCNVENAAYGITVCAETVAVAKAVSEGSRNIAAVAVAADTAGVCRPCGSCRQFILEFGDEIVIIMGNLKGDRETRSIKELIPFSFSSRDLD
ncbi:cytidine deaminase [Desulfitibacter alkalitolerans]|uniref:cytidine deaminase n=1 Tax=Desulfitibacter alkalitolerans TaxID=264641 RepID=UPI000484EDBB|nr:cytidine deaminase [Desulfitibacter alkalitolerans]